MRRTLYNCWPGAPLSKQTLPQDFQAPDRRGSERAREAQANLVLDFNLLAIGAALWQLRSAAASFVGRAPTWGRVAPNLVAVAEWWSSTQVAGAEAGCSCGRREVDE